MRRTAASRVLSILLLLLSAWGASARAERVLLRDGPSLTGEIGARYRAWTLKKGGSKDVSVSEWAMPLLARKPLGERGEISLSVPLVAASLDGDESSEYLGIADATLAGSVLLGGGGTRAAFTLGLPTGESRAAADEAELAGAVANRVLGLPVKRFGEGWDAGASLVHAFFLSRAVTFSAGAGFLRKGEYAFAGSGGPDETYDSGDEVFLAAGTEGEWGPGERSLRVAADLRYRMFGKDRRGGEDFYEEGDEVDLLLDAGLLLAPGRRVDLRGFLAFKGEGSESGAFGRGALDSLSIERYLLRGLNGNDQEFAAAYAHRLTARLEIVARALVGNFGEYPHPEGRGEEERLLGSGRVFELGGGVRLDFSPRIRVSVDAARLSGAAEGGAVDLSGFEVAAAARWSY